MNLLIDKTKISKDARLSAGNWLLRPYTEADLEVIFKAYTDPTITYFMGKEPMSNRAEAADIIQVMQKRMEQGTGIAWVIIDQTTGEKLGHAGLWEISEMHCRAEVGYALLSPFQNKGVMTAVLPVILNYAFNEVRLHSVFANISTDNDGSRKLLERNGFSLDARFRENHKYKDKFIDSLIYTKLETDE